MEFKNTAEALYVHAKEIVELIAGIEASEDIHAIELDLLLEKLRDIYDLVSDMKAAVSVQKKAGKPEPSKKADEDDRLSEHKILPDLAEDKKKDDTIAVNGEKKQEKGKKTEQVKSSFVSDRFKASKPTFNEEMAGKSKVENLSSHLNITPINSIAGAIGLNEKFELVNELFDGSKDKFESTIEVLNQADSFVEAYNYLNENFDWDMDSVYVQRILELIRRKLIVRRNEK
ncbi:MAG: hypothetical protein JXB24_08260 [Bacteroidales bacterium]|nr:hypothetical protein [Bacteroidales bacterium]